VTRSLAFFLVALLLAAAAYELALALGVSKVGPEPGEGVAGSGIVELVAIVAMMAGAIVGLVGIVRPRRATPLLAPAAGLFALGMEYTYDPYYAPSQHRFSDGGAVPVWWILALLGGSGAVAAFNCRFPRLGSPLTTLTLLVWVLTTAFLGDGH
jgi:hypothetical protein